MNDAPSGSPHKPSPRRRTTFRLVLILFGIITLSVVLLLVISGSSRRGVNWLTPEEAAKATRPSGPLVKIKEKLKTWAAPLWRWYQGKRPKIQLESHLFLLSPELARQTGLGTPVATNADGMRALILPRAELEKFKQHFKIPDDQSIITAPSSFSSGAYPGPSPHTTTGDGQNIHLGMGGPLTLSPTNLVATAMNLDVLPRKSAGTIRLLLAANLQELLTEISFPSNQISFRTNTFACRVAVPDAGGLVIQCSDWGATGNTNYWLILSPAAVYLQKK